MDRRAWGATVHRVTQRQTPLKRLGTHAQPGLREPRAGEEPQGLAVKESCYTPGPKQVGAGRRKHILSSYLDVCWHLPLLLILTCTPRSREPG